jgi:signal transduction histidine kinase
MMQSLQPFKTYYASLVGIAAIFEDAEVRRRAELCIHSSMIVGGISLLTAPLYLFVIQSLSNLVVGLVYSIFTLLTVVVMRATRSQVFAANYFLFLLLGIVTFFCVLMGGINSSLICCLFVVPFHALNLLGQRGMVVWIGLVFLDMMVLVLLQASGVAFLPAIPLDAPIVVCISFGLVVGTVAVIVKVADDQRIRLYKQALHEREQAQTANLELDAINERLLVQNSQLAAMNDEKNGMMGILAHDLKNPLSNILFFSNTLEHRAEKKLAEEDMTRYAAMMHESATRMNALIQNLLNVHSLESGAAVLQWKTIHLAAFVGAAMESHKARAAAKNITLNLSLDENIGNETLTVSADETLLTQVLDNLLSNAVKYSLPGKDIYITINNVLYANSEVVRVAVHNEGEGIAPEELPKLFQKFTRLSAKPTGGEDSTGLGLAIVKHCMERLGGRVWCESEYGKNATFIVELPKLVQKLSK